MIGGQISGRGCGLVYVFNLLDLTNCLGLKQIICEPTHFSHVGSPSLIDLVFVPSDFSCPSYVLPPISSSDHLSILFSVPLAHSVKHSPSASRFRKVWLYNKANFDSANLLLSSLPWDSLFSSNDVNFCWSIFKEAFLEVMRRTIPSKFVFSSYSLPRGNNHLLACIKKRNHLFRLAKKFKSPSYMSLYRTCRNKTLSYQRKLKASFFNRLSLSSSSSKSFWSLYSKLKKKPSTLPNLTHNGLNASDSISKANMMNNFFSQCFNSSVPPLSLSDNLPSAYCSPDLLCTPETIIQLISQLPAITSPGLDRISSKMLKATSHSISVPLSVLFNLSLSSGIFPTDWKSSVVIPVPKQSASISSPSNYRPISLLPLVSKLLERHVFNWLYKYCQSHNILHNNQFGFRPSFSTESALITTTHSWFSLLDSKFSICAVFFDLCKAFDSIPHRPLLDTLLSYNIPPHLVNWFQSYLSLRSQQVAVDNSLSSKSHVISGVPQGSILGPLLFILYINEISSLPLPQSFSITLYADDILLSCPYKSPSDIPSIQSSINLLSSWLNSKYLTINPLKTKYMIISRKASTDSASFSTLYLNGLLLERVFSFKYLGVIINSQLNWSTHIDYVCSKTRKLLGLIFRHFYFHSSSTVLFKLYQSLILPHLSYCSSLWDPHQGNNTNKLEAIQFFALKLCTKQWSSSYQSLLDQLSLPRLSTRRKVSKLFLLYKFIYHIAYIPQNILLYQSCTSHLRSFHPLNIKIPLSRTNSTLYSFFPNTSSLWNTLPSYIKDSNTPRTFKMALITYFKA